MPARTAALVSLMLALPACAESPVAPTRAPALALPAGAARPFPASPCRPGVRDPAVLACVDGVAVTRAAYERVVDSYPAGTSPTAIVRALIDAEILARQAAAKGLWSAWLLPELERTLAKRYIEKHFEDEYPADKVSDADLKKAWWNWSIRIRYVHEPMWFATDAQLLCCTGDWRQCDIRPEVRKCIDDLEPQARALYAELAKDVPRGPREMQGRVYALSHRFPKAAVADVNFYYIPGVPWKEQVGRGYVVMVEPYVEAVTKLKVGELSKPIRTPFGWHISRLDRHEPPVNKSLHDPEVRRDIAEHILPQVRKRDLQAHAYTLMAERGVKVSWPKRSGGSR